MHSRIHVLQTYMDALGRSDYGTVTSLFTAGGLVKSPFLGEMPAGPFFDRLAGASAKNVITPIDIFVSNSGKNHATAYFQYHWTVRDGTVITFKVMDLFTFEPAATRSPTSTSSTTPTRSECRLVTSTSCEHKPDRSVSYHLGATCPLRGQRRPDWD